MRNFFKGIFYLLVAIILFSIISASTGCNGEQIKVMFDNYEKNGGRLEDLKKVAVLNLSGKNRGTGADIANKLADQLYQQGYMEVMDRQETIDKLRNAGLPISGILSLEDARQASKVLGVDGLIYGKVNANFRSCVYNRPMYSYPIDYYRRGRGGCSLYIGPSYTVPYLNRKGKVDLSVHIYDARIKDEIGKIDLNKSYNKNFNEYFMGSSVLGAIYFYDRLQKMAMPSDYDMMVLMADRSVKRLVEGFTPYYVSRVRKLQEGVVGADLAKEGKWEQAKDIWERFIKRSPANWQVSTNLGIFYERKGNPLRALSYYKQALKYNPKSEDLRKYIYDTEKSSVIKKYLMPISIKNKVSYKITEIKPDGRIYITAGKEDGIRVKEQFTVVRPYLEFQDDLVTPKGYVYYPLGVLKINKVFEGVSWGRIKIFKPGEEPKEGDIIIKYNISYN